VCDLPFARFYGADLASAHMLRCVLREADFREANLSGVKLGATSFARARFGGAKMFAADLRAADLRGARELTQEQLSQALTDSSTTLPNGKSGPYLRFSGAEKPLIR